MAKKVTRTATKKAANAATKKLAKRSAPKKVVAKKVAAKAAPKPRGSALVSLSAGFTANDAAASIKWYCDVLGFKVIERWEHEGRFLGAQSARAASSSISARTTGSRAATASKGRRRGSTS